jgi:anti-sigma regulatory factor (Ser/Thr protein kinase)
LAERLGADETTRGRLALIVTEAAGNLIKHASGGELIVQPTESHGAVGIELLILDRGPGMPSIEECLRDGYSTSGTPGHGLGAIKRLSDQFEIYSQPSRGTAILSHVWLGGTPKAEPVKTVQFRWGGVSVPKSGEPVCGDGWAVEVRGDQLVAIQVDGLGHGAQAADAANEALRTFRKDPWREPHLLLDAVHGSLRETRGAAAAVARIDTQQGALDYAGVGNIAATIVGATRSTSLVSHGGILGHQVRKVQQFSYPWATGSTLLMHSDGVATQWRIDRYPGILSRSPALIAAVLYRDFKRDRDDSTVAVVDGRASS